MQIQGQTIRSPTGVVVDLRHAWQPSQVYVMLSRAQKLNQIFITGNLNTNNWKVHEKAMEELLDSEDNALNLANDSDYFKILSLNVYSLRKHFSDILRAQEQNNYQMMCFQETWLNEFSDPADYKIDGLNLHLNSVGLGKGVATYCSEQFQLDVHITEPNCQLTRVSSDDFDVINVYRSSNCHDFFEKLQPLIREERSTLVIGDFNIDLTRRRPQKYQDFLRTFEMEQLVLRPTHMQGGLIDHVLINKVGFNKNF